MTRYIASSPRSDWFDDDSPLCPNIHAPEATPVDTGLVTVFGAPIMRLPNPMGFGRDSEW